MGETMVNMTLSLPDDLHRRMRKYPEIKWSALARQAILGYLEKLEIMDELLKDSKLTEDDVKELDIMVKRAIMDKIRKRKKVK